MNKTSIEWVKDAAGIRGFTWNPVKGCSHVSEGCRNCWAERMAVRFCGMTETYTMMGPGQLSNPEVKREPFQEFAAKNGWTGRVGLDEVKLDEPLRRKKPAVIFVGSMSDLFHEKLTDKAIWRVADVMRKASQHRYTILTKRARRMANLWPKIQDSFYDPLEHIILGVSCEDQAAADERIPHLLATRVACRMVSVEPMLGPVKLPQCNGHPNCKLTGVEGHSDKPLGGLDWVICGGESGPGARPMHPDWVRKLRDQCQAAGVPFLFKQWGEWAPFGITRTDVNGNALSVRERYDKATDTYRLGKKAAGRMLDGRVWDELPEILK